MAPGRGEQLVMLGGSAAAGDEGVWLGLGRWRRGSVSVWPAGAGAGLLGGRRFVRREIGLALNGRPSSGLLFSDVAESRLTGGMMR